MANVLAYVSAYTKRMNYVTDLQSAFASVATARANAVEQACEKALQGGVCGVAVIDLTGPATNLGAAPPTAFTHVTVDLLVGPHLSVPYGQIMQFPSRAAFDAYVARRDHELSTD